MRGPRLKVVAISWPHVRDVVPLASSTIEKRASVKAEGLKIWTRFPSRCQRTNALPMKPTAINTNCQ